MRLGLSGSSGGCPHVRTYHSVKKIVEHIIGSVFSTRGQFHQHSHQRAAFWREQDDKLLLNHKLGEPTFREKLNFAT